MNNEQTERYRLLRQRAGEILAKQPDPEIQGLIRELLEARNGVPGDLVPVRTDSTECQRMEDVLLFLAQSINTPGGENFFYRLARFLATCLDMDFICIDILEEGHLSARTLAVYCDGKFEDNISYTLQDTPCGEVVEKKVCCYREGVRHKFMKDLVLQDLMAESYVGTILWSSEGAPIGLIAIIGRKPLANPWLAERLLQIVGVRAAAELERGIYLESLQVSETRLKQAEETLQKLNEELSRSNRDLEQFASVASHDLQEPLRMVASYTELLSRRYGGQLDEQAHSFIRYALDGTVRMQLLIEGLLAYSRVGTKGRPTRPTDTRAVVAEALNNLQATIVESGAVITVRNLPTVQATASLLIQLFQNLIGNAIKFRRPGEAPRIDISAKNLGEEWRFFVQDNGIGINPQHADKVFDLFQRLHTREEYPGTGIGLAVCKRIVERHGGRIRVESTPGQGTTFLFTLAAPPPTHS